MRVYHYIIIYCAVCDLYTIIPSAVVYLGGVVGQSEVLCVAKVVQVVLEIVQDTEHDAVFIFGCHQADIG